MKMNQNGMKMIKKKELMRMRMTKKKELMRMRIMKKKVQKMKKKSMMNQLVKKLKLKLFTLGNTQEMDKKLLMI